MRYLPLLLTFVLISYFQSYAIDTTKIIYNDFSNLSSWQLNGTARGAAGVDLEKVLQLTTNKISQSGSAFIKNPINLVSDKGFMASFSAYFSFRMSNTGGLNEGDGAGADGIVFVIQTVANNVGSVGGGLGYRGIKNSIGIEFDTWNNADSSNDPDHNHVGIDTNGTTRSIKTFSENTLFNNGKIWYVWIDYDGDNQVLEVRYDSLNNRPTDPKISQTINIPSLLVKENVYVGFTSATGSSYNTHDILAFNFVNKFQPYLYSISISARPDTIVNPMDTITLIATVRDMSNTIQPDSSGKASWRIINDGGNPLSILQRNTGSEVTLVPRVAGSAIIIECSAVVYGQTLVDTITIHVKEQQKYSLDIVATPDTVIQSHDTVLLKAVVLDSKHNIVPENADKTMWTIINKDGNPAEILKSTTGAQVVCVPEIAFTTVSIEATVFINNVRVADTIQIHVVAGDPYRLSIEKKPFPGYTDVDLDTIILSKENRADSVFAVVRDKWGALCSVADSLLTTWNVVYGQNIVKVTGVDKRKYVGLLERMGSEGYSIVEVAQGLLVKDSVVIKTTGVIIDKIAIRDNVSGLKLDSLIAKIGQVRSLVTIGCIAGLDPAHEDSWIPVDASWSTTGDITFKNVLPKGASQWEMIADNSGKGILTVKNGSFEKSIPLTIIPQSGVITITATSNPFKIGQALSSVLPAQILSLYSNVLKNSNGNGVIVAVYSSIPLKQSGEFYGVAVIYDALGNIVCRGLKLNSANASTKTDYGIYWNGMNEHGRTVGQGTYLIRVAIVDIFGTESVLNLKLGVDISGKQE